MLCHKMSAQLAELSTDAERAPLGRPSDRRRRRAAQPVPPRPHAGAGRWARSGISSQEISEYTNINATQIRRDLSGFGKFGKRGVGYNVDGSRGEIRKILRTQGQHNIALFGAGRLGQAVANSSVFADHGFNIAAAFDIDPDKVGQPIDGLQVLDYERLADVIREKNIIVAVLAVPGDAAQSVADDVVRAGVKIIFNYTDALLNVPQRRRPCTRRARPSSCSTRSTSTST